MAMGIVEKAKKVFLHPSKFFDSIKSEKGVKEAFKYTAVISIVSVIGSFIASASLMSFLSLLGLPQEGSLFTGMSYILPIVMYVVVLLSSFVGAGIIHLIAMLLKGKGNYAATYKAMMYANTPSSLLGWIPLLGFVFSLYSIYLEIMGISKLHNVSMLRAAAIVLIIPIVVAVIVAMALAYLAYAYFTTIFQLATA